MTPLHTLVVGVDFSETSEDALESALELAAHRDGHIHLVHVVPDVLHTPWMVEAAGVDFQGVQQQWVDDANRQLVDFAAQHRVDPQRVTTTVLVGPPATEIVRYATEHAANVIVLGTHGRGRVTRFLLGSVADRVVREARCPVMLVPHHTLWPTTFAIETASGIES